MTRAEIETIAAAERAAVITIPVLRIAPGDLMDRGMDKLRTVHLALNPDSKGWLDDAVLLSVWSTLDAAIRDLEPVRNRLQGVDQSAKVVAGIPQDSAWQPELPSLIAAHDAALAVYDAQGDNYDKDDDSVGRAVDAARDAILNHRPATLAEVATKAAYMLSKKTFIEWDNFDRHKLIEALAPIGAA